jgi:hypothetical protein
MIAKQSDNKATKSEHRASHRQRVIHLNSPLQLLRAKRSSALMDARMMEAQIVRLNESAENAGITTNLRSILQMFRDYVATLDEAIKLAKLQDANLSA